MQDVLLLTGLVFGVMAFLGATVMACYRLMKEKDSRPLWWLIGTPLIAAGLCVLGFLLSPVAGMVSLIIFGGVGGLAYLTLVVFLNRQLYTTWRQERDELRLKRAGFIR